MSTHIPQVRWCYVTHLSPGYWWQHLYWLSWAIMSIDALEQDCTNSIANALELLQSFAKPSMYTPTWCLLISPCYQPAQIACYSEYGGLIFLFLSPLGKQFRIDDLDKMHKNYRMTVQYIICNDVRGFTLDCGNSSALAQDKIGINRTSNFQGLYSFRIDIMEAL